MNGAYPLSSEHAEITMGGRGDGPSRKEKGRNELSTAKAEGGLKEWGRKAWKLAHENFMNEKRVSKDKRKKREKNNWLSKATGSRYVSLA